MCAMLTLPDKTSLPVADCIAVANRYIKYGSGIIPFYDGTNTGPHDLLAPTDVMSLVALNPWRGNPFDKITIIWENRARVEEAAKTLTKRPIEMLATVERQELLWPAHNALYRVREEIPYVGDVIATKLLHRLRPNIIPIWDDKRVGT